ncbi:MAG: hypothetical protein M1825_004133 [Sarcosagium campestre]|nr:MAG: hypothetical protein M1825_004133 [Sarcosagium campestre]
MEPPAIPDDEDDDMSLFAPVLNHVRLDRLPAFASSVRRHLLNANCEKSSADNSTISCSLQAPPLFGAYNILFPLQFEDGPRWLLKVPGTAYPGRWDEQAARALKGRSTDHVTSESQIFSFETSMDNELNSAFILMEYIKGVPLHDVWFDKQISREVIESRRLQCLQDVAKMMVQLDQFSFTQSGSPIFDNDGYKVIDVGPAIKPDSSTMLDRLITDDDDKTAIFCDVGLPRYSNVLVSKEVGRLCALIDWDGVTIVPRCLGNERYPSWLTRDWDPAKYGYKADGSGETLVDNENSPDELAFYPAKYEQFVQECKGHEDSSAKTLTLDSLLIENLSIAADDPISTVGVVSKVFSEVRARVVPHTTEEEEEEFHLWEICDALGDGDLDARSLEWLKHGFEALLYHE